MSNQCGKMSLNSKNYQQYNSDQANFLKPLVTFEESQIRFHDDVAKETIANDCFRNKKITLVSVMGPSRSGKSFLMSFLTGGKKGNQIRGAFQSGYERHTEGILIFMYPMVSDDGSHAIFFLDTQGTFDLQTDRNVSAWIAGFSLLFSDVQILNLRGNIGGDDLHDLHMFVESAAAFSESKLAKSLIYAIRDAPHWEESDFLKKLWAQNEKSKDMKEISESLRNRFPNEIDCVCVAPASDRIRRANGIIDLNQEDFNLLHCLENLRDLVYHKCQSASKAQYENLISSAEKIIKYLKNEAPELKTSVQVIQEATVIQAVNKAYEAFHKAIKDATSDTIVMAEKLGKAEVKTKLESLLMNKKHLIAEAHELLDPKIEEMIAKKRQEFDQIANEKRILKKAEIFALTWRTRIQKITHLKDALELKNGQMIEKEANATNTIPLAIRHSLEEALEARIVVLKAQFIRTRLSELDTELRVFLLTSEFAEIPDEQWIKSHIDSLLKRFQEECNTNSIEEAQSEMVKEEIRNTLGKTGFNCRNMIVSKMLARKEAEDMEAQLAANAQNGDSINNIDSDCDSSSLNEDSDDKGALEAKKSSSSSLDASEKFKKSQNTAKINNMDKRHDFQASEQNLGSFYLSQGALTSRTATHLNLSVGESQEPNVYDYPASIATLNEDSQRSDSSEYEEISDADIDVLVPKDIDDAVMAEMNVKFQVLKAIMESAPNVAEIREHFIALYNEFATWCEIRINTKVMMYFVNKFHDECQAYIFEQYKLKIDISQNEDEILQRTENPNWTDAQKLRRKVLKRRTTKPYKKKLSTGKVESLLSRLMQKNIETVKRSGITKQGIWNLIECSKSHYDSFTSALEKYDKHNELLGLLNKVLVEKWLEFLHLLPENGFDEEATVNEYRNVCKELNLQVPDEKHNTFLHDIPELFRLKREEEQRQKRYFAAGQGRQALEQHRYLCLPDATLRGRCQGQRTSELPRPNSSQSKPTREQPREQRFAYLGNQAYTAHSPFH